MMQKIAVIIPVLNEAATIGDTVGRVRDAGAHCVVVDGGSDDDTAAIAASRGAQVISARRGRAAQMNAGGLAAGDFEILVFLHADVALPENWCKAVRGAVDAGASWGRFDVSLNSPLPLLRAVGAMMNLRSRLTGIATGDQAIFIRRAAFDALGGYADLPLMEDVELCTRLRRARLPAAPLRDRVSVSARRWEQKGPLRTIVLMWVIRALFQVGIPARHLHRIYYGRR
jgi:rSAM/selenodomain-associated transferase 2